MISYAIAFVVGDFDTPLSEKQGLQTTDEEGNTIWVPATIVNDIEDVEKLREEMHGAVDRTVNAYLKLAS